MTVGGEKNPIELFLHCMTCLTKKQLEDLDFGLDKDGIPTVYCNRCKRTVARLTPEILNEVLSRGCACCGKEEHDPAEKENN